MLAHIAEVQRATLKDVHRRKLPSFLQAIPQIDGQAEVASPEGIAALSVLLARLQPLSDGMHSEGACPIEPYTLTAPAIKLQKRITITRCPMAQIRTFRQRSHLPRQFPAFFQQSIDRRLLVRRQRCQCYHHAWRAVTILHEDRHLSRR